MTQRAGGPVQRYLLDGSDEDLKRLLGLAEAHGEMARNALRRSGIAPGWTVVECGCGPVGALVQMAELVGDTGQVTGIDLNPAAADRARSVAAALGLGNVRTIAADVHDLEAADAGGPFDLAYTRLLLVHQQDPRRTLRQIAGLVKPGGWVIAQEPLAQPLPRSFPDFDAVGAAWSLMTDLMERSGVPAQAAERLPQWAAAAGLEIVRMDGSFSFGSPEAYFGLYASALTAMRERAVGSGLTTGQDIDALVTSLAAAQPAAYEWVTSPPYLDLTLRKPA